jgi:pimeloyl-ACP methyl ester carboxylesterase
MTDYARAVADLARDCETPPVLVGHSMGGLVALMAAARARTSGLVLIAPSSPWGVTTAAMEDAISAIGLISLNAYWGSPVDPERGLFDAYGGERLSAGVRDAVFSRLVPESGRALSETLNWWMDPFMTTNVPTWQVKVPALFLAGGRDRVHPPGQVRQTAERFGADFRLFDDMSHWMIAEPGWRGVAEAALDWLAGALKKAA